MEALYYSNNIKLLTNKSNKYKTQEQLLFYPTHIMKIPNRKDTREDDINS